ncbi:tRNA-binding protein [Candidatus Odyssella acanthamoebae]|uniref:tRNA-binding protein n=1 Tax=Candidatus Odyssella acanthamoebae TaxID=91604 RepID=A0A077AYB7_9PROT|nr:tRNA-binding protein [Candidatus Paracaedibacter acanthamoebae]AIK96979.1 tRNA-binding protein [Candidatus Paracaedibacter acanthamoebae]
MTITYDDFDKVDLRAGTIVKAEINVKAKKSAYKIWVDFVETIGIKQTSAQVTYHYTPESLIGKSVIGCLNLGARNIAGFMSEFLLVGFSDPRGNIILATTDQTVPNGQKLH